MDDIKIVAYDPQWSALFDEEAARLRSTLGGEPIAGLEHFGSTAIPQLAAKPIIDILIAVPSLNAARAVFPAKLKTLDYVFWADNPKNDRLFFVKGMPPYGERRTHHVHVTEPAGELWLGVSRLPARPSGRSGALRSTKAKARFGASSRSRSLHRGKVGLRGERDAQGAGAMNLSPYICPRCGPFFRIVAGATGLVFGLRDSASAR